METEHPSAVNSFEDNEKLDFLIKSIETIEDYAIFILNGNGEVKTWNHGARRIKGYFHSEIIGQNFSIFYTEEAVARTHPHNSLQIASDRSRFEEECWLVRKSGEKYRANVVLTSFKGSSGGVIAYSMVIRDLTDKKLDEERLRLSEGKFRRLIENVKDYGIFMLDKNGHITTWNRGAKRIKGYSSEEIIGKHFSVFYPEDDIRAGKPEIELKIATGEEEKFEEVGWRLKKDGERFLAHVTIAVIKNENDEVMGFTKITRDLSEKKKLEELEDAIKIRDEFISVASHELRTPVTKLLMNIQMMKKLGDDIDKEKMLRYLSMCEHSTRELAILMDNMVDVSRLRIGKLVLRRTKTNFTNLVINEISSMKDEIRLSGSHVSFSHDGDVIGYWDQGRLQQVIHNLLGNAIKYGEGNPIKLQLRKSQDTIWLVISDEGQGIPYHLQPRIFERFERAVKSSNVSGLGLGLYVVKQVIVAHQGEINLESKPHKGTTITITLPLKKK